MNNRHEEKGISDILAWTLANKGGGEGGAGFVAQPEPPTDKSKIWIDTDDETGCGGGGGSEEYATKKDLQLVEENKADRSIYLLDNSVITQADARDILAYADQYTGVIEFISTSESKVSAIGYIISNSDGTCLVTITNDGTSTQWSKDGFSKYNVEARNLINEPIVDTDNLTVDVVGNPPVLYMLRNAMNKPESSGADGSMVVIPHSISKQIFVYTDMDTAKMWTKVVTGTDGQHSFGTWNVLGGGGSGGVGQNGIGIDSETFNDIAPEKATGKNSHIEGSQSYLKEYQGVTVSNINAIEQTYEISVDINKDVFPHVMQFWQNGELKFAFITRSYDKYAGFVVTSYSDISALTPGNYDIKLVSGLAMGDRSHVEGNNNIANSRESHVEGWNNMVTGWVDGNGKKIGDGVAAHAEGRETRAIGRASHAEGRLTKAVGEHSHAEGGPLYNGEKPVEALGKSSHAEGSVTTASGNASHAEGNYTTASGEDSHAEGIHTTASGENSHAEGIHTTASGYSSHAEGYDTTASGDYGSHAEGSDTTASGENQHVQGKYNIDDPTGKYAHIVGNGNYRANSNAHTLDWQGNSWYQGSVLVGGTDMDAPMSVLAPDHIIIKASDSEDRFKITVDKTGAIKAEKVV